MSSILDNIPLPTADTSRIGILRRIVELETAVLESMAGDTFSQAERYAQQSVVLRAAIDLLDAEEEVKS